MSAFKKILIAIDDETDEHMAIQQGLTLATLQNSSVNILAIIKDTEEFEESLFEIIKKEELHRRLLQHHRSRIQDIVNEYNSSNVEITIDIATGLSFVEIIRKAFSIDADIIIQSSHPDARQHLTFSSSDWHLMRKSPIPVWVVKTPLPEKNSRIVVAIDTMGSSDDTAFNRSILTLATNITNAFNASLTIYSAWQLVGEEMMRYSPFLRVTEDTLDEMLEKQALKAQQKSQEISAWLYKNKSLNTNNISWQLEKGNARDTISKYVNTNNTDLLIMGTVNRTGIPGLLIGNTAETVLSNVSCSVLTMKPPLFDSPIKKY